MHLPTIASCGGSSIRRRRLWIKVAPASLTDNSSPTVVTVGGLARSDSGNFTDEFATLLKRLKPDDEAATPELVPAGVE